jgi:hypothetical protein
LTFKNRDIHNRVRDQIVTQATTRFRAVFIHGYDAYLRNLHPDENPYPVGLYRHAWISGYLSAASVEEDVPDAQKAKSG